MIGCLVQNIANSFYQIHLLDRLYHEILDTVVEGAFISQLVTETGTEDDRNIRTKLMNFPGQFNS